MYTNAQKHAPPSVFSVLLAAGTSMLAFWHFFKRPVNSAKAFKDKYIGSFFHSIKNPINP
jgi:hypothetical protein